MLCYACNVKFKSEVEAHTDVAQAFWYSMATKGFKIVFTLPLNLVKEYL